MKNVVIGKDEQVFCITKGAQIVDVNVSDEEGLEGAKGKTICRPWLWVKILLLHHRLIVASRVMFEGRKYLQDHP